MGIPKCPTVQIYLLLSVGIPRGRARARHSFQEKPSASLEESRFSAADGRVVPHVHEATELLVLHKARRLERGPLEDVCVPDEARSAASFVGSKIILRILSLRPERRPLLPLIRARWGTSDDGI